MASPPEDLLTLACDLTANLAEEDRYRRVLEAVRRMIPCDAAALLRRDAGDLVPLAVSGLVPEVMGRRFAVKDEPRLGLILARREPTRFPADSAIPDPYDGLVLGDPHACAHVHACLGAPLLVGNEVIGALTLDAFDPAAFDAVDDRTVAALAAFAAATVRTAGLIETLEKTARRQGQVLKQLVDDDRATRDGKLVGTSHAMQRLRSEIRLVAGSDLAVLVTGETGVGKELVARAIHAASGRADQPFCQFNCAAVPETLAESELFGHLRGAFTGATSDRAGKFEVADGGTLFLDEVGDLPPAVQPKLLRALESGELQRVGSDRIVRVDVRVIAATNRDLASEQSAGTFRRDLYHRLAVYPIRVPSLRERRSDVPLLAGAFLEREAARHGLKSLRLDAASREALLAYPWPGNVRELEHVLMRAALRAASQADHGDAVIRVDQLGRDLANAVAASPRATAPQHVAGGRPTDESGAPDAPPRAASPGIDTSTPESGPSPDPRPLRSRLDDFARRQVEDALRRHRGVFAAAARELGLTRGNLLRLARRLGLR